LASGGPNGKPLSLWNLKIRPIFSTWLKTTSLLGMNQLELSAKRLQV
jgi:hypothetical protein